MGGIVKKSDFWTCYMVFLPQQPCQINTSIPLINTACHVPDMLILADFKMLFNTVDTQMYMNKNE